MIRSYTYCDTDPLDAAFTQLHTVTEAYAGTPGARETRLHSKFVAPFLTQRREVFVDGHLIDQVDISARSDGGGNYRIETRYPSAGGPPQVTRYDYDSNPYRPLHQKITKPDGTVEITNEEFSTGQRTTSTFVGTFNPHSSTVPIFTGSASSTTVSDTGQILQSSTSIVRGGVSFLLEERVATSLDFLERPLTYDFFHGAKASASYTETLEYGCCGVSRRTGRDGISTYSYYDALNRVVKTHRNGLATETIHDGLTTHIHTYPEAIPSSLSLANPSNESGFITRDLTGAVIAQGSRSPQDDSLQSTTIATTYAPAAGIGMRVVTTAPQTTDDQGVLPTTTQEFYLDGSPASTRGPLVADQQMSYSATAVGLVQTVARLDAGGSPFEAVVTQTDWLGRPQSITYAGDANGDSQPDRALAEFDSGGRPLKLTDPDGVTTLFSYDLTNEVTTTALDLDNDGVITIGSDQISTLRRGQSINPADELILWTETTIRDDANLERTLARAEFRSDGLESWSYAYDNSVPSLTYTLTSYLPATPGAWDTVTEFPNGNSAIQRIRNGRLDNTEVRDSSDGSLISRSYGYDSYHRINHLSDSSGPDVDTTYVSNHHDLVASRSVGTLLTSFSYDHRGRRTLVDAPDSLDDTGAPVDNQRSTSHFPHGGIREVTGTPGYHLSYTYDEANRMSTLSTAGTHSAVTRWLYDSDRGWLSAKLHDSPTPATGSGPSYTYTAAGRLATRLSERGTTTTHSYGSDGRIQLTSYSDGTPSVSILNRDSRGRIQRLSDAGGERTFTYNDYDTLTATNYEAGHVLHDWSVQQSRDTLGRLNALTLHGAGSDQHHLAFGYDTANRLESVQANNLAAWYHYDPTRQRVAQLSVSNAQEAILYTTRSYDALNRLDRISSHNGEVHAQFALYGDAQAQRDDVGRITHRTRTDGTQWRFGYKSTGELSTAKLHLSNSSPDEVLGHFLAWTYDGIGNRSSSSANDPPVPTNSTANVLNQPSTVQSPGLADVFGEAPLTTEVLVNGATATRQGPFFHHSLSANNAVGPLWQAVSVQNDGNTTNGHLPIPAANVVPTHDADGNLTQNGLWDFTWDAENRLTQAATSAAAIAAGFPYHRVTYLYDAESRRIQRQHFDAPAAVVPTDTTRYLYAGWRCLGELDGSNLLTRSFAWGLDNNDALHLGDPNAALLWIHDHSSGDSHLTHYDLNGNITGLVSAQTKSPSANYAYSPFGKLLTATGPYAQENPYRFSTQFQDPTTELLYYGYRHLDTKSGRWLSRDPAGEDGGANLYAFLGNDGVNQNDVLGLISCGRLKHALMMAQFADAAYDRGNLPDGWSEERVDRVTSDTGLEVRVYKNKTGGRVIAFRGTDGLSDWDDNANNLVGLVGGQYFEARNDLEALAKKHPNAEVVGHSLGGGLASVYGTRHGRVTTTFNAAGPGQSTLSTFGINRTKALDFVNAFFVRGEILSAAQDLTGKGLGALDPTPNAVGVRIPLNPALADNRPSGLFEFINPLDNLGRALLPATLHGMEEVIQALEKRIKACCK